MWLYNLCNLLKLMSWLFYRYSLHSPIQKSIMIQINKEQLTERFMRYVQIDTQSNPESKSFPSTEKQKDLSRILFAELQAMGLQNSWSKASVVAGTALAT